LKTVNYDCNSVAVIIDCRKKRPLFLADSVTFSTSQLADNIAADGRLVDRDPLGLGSPLMGSGSGIDMVPTATEKTAT